MFVSGATTWRTGGQLITDAPDSPLAQFDAGMQEGRLLLQWCSACARSFHRPRLVCPACGSRDWSWHDSEGAGSVYSVTSVVRPARAFRSEAPFQVAIVELEGGARMMGRIVGPDVSIGDRVRFTPPPEADTQATIRFEAVR